MMYHGFPIPFIAEIFSLLLLFDLCLIQLPPMVVLIYEWLKLLEKYSGIMFDFEEMVLLIWIVEEQQPEYPLFKVKWKASPAWTCTCLPCSCMSWWGSPILSRGIGVTWTFELATTVGLSVLFLCVVLLIPLSFVMDKSHCAGKAKELNHCPPADAGVLKRLKF